MRRALFACALLLGACVHSPDESNASSTGVPADAGARLDGAAPDAGPLGSLVLSVLDETTLLPVPSRVIFRPVPGAGFADSVESGMPDPLSPGGATGALLSPGVVGSTEGVLLASGQGTVQVPPGHYTLVATRGPEYEMVLTDVDVAAGEVQSVVASLEHTVDTTGWVAADMHVHTARSFDSKLPLERRLISMVSNGVEVVVATDHNIATDLSPVAASLGYGPDVLSTIVGDEFNFAEGHGGAYPLVYDASKPGGGAPPYVNLRNGVCTPPLPINCLHAAQAFGVMHGQMPGTTVVTVNHPYWANGDLGYFTNIRWGAGTDHGLPSPLDTAGLFDALEVLNGYQTNVQAEQNLVDDWFYLLSHGHRVTALGNSDTHKINWVRAGWPRTWLRVASDRPGDVDGAVLADAIRNGRAIASTGPFVNLTVDEGEIGDVIVPARDSVQVSVTVDAPSWIDVDRVVVYLNGEVLRVFGVTPGQRPRFAASFPARITGDSYVVALASGSQPLPPDVVGEYAHQNGYEMLPWAITNPVFIDADGNGKWFPAPAATPHAPPPHHPFRGQIGQGCDPSELVGTEPPLDTPEETLMPLLYR